MKSLLLVTLGVLCMSTASFGKLVTKSVEYKHGVATLEGYLAYDDSFTGKRPGVLVIHEWKGLNDYAKMRADKLAGLGYVAFALDMYGEGIRPTDPKEASAQAAIYYKDRPLMRSRAQAGLDQLLANPLVDKSKVAVIGYCFGGSCALELARSGAPVAGTVTFHGGLTTPTPQDAVNVKGKVLVLHGGADPNVKPEDVAALEKEMTDAKVDWQVNIYSDAVHGFTNPANGDDPSKGVAYNARADARSWEAMKAFFAEIFK